MADTTYFPLCLEIISYTSFPMINCYSLIIALFSSSWVISCDPWWSSSFEVDLPLSEALSFIMMSRTLGALDSCLLNCHHLFFGTSLILLFCGWLYRTFPTIQMHQLHGYNHFIKHMHNNKFLCIMQLFSQHNIHPYLTTVINATSLYKTSTEYNQMYNITISWNDNWILIFYSFHG